MWKNVFKIAGLVIGVGLVVVGVVFAPGLVLSKMAEQLILVGAGSGLVCGILGHSLGTVGHNQAINIESHKKDFQIYQSDMQHPGSDLSLEEKLDLINARLANVEDRQTHIEIIQKKDSEKMGKVEMQLEAKIRNENTSKEHHERILRRRQYLDAIAQDQNKIQVTAERTGQSQQTLFASHSTDADGINLNPVSPRI